MSDDIRVQMGQPSAPFSVRYGRQGQEHVVELAGTVQDMNQRILSVLGLPSGASIRLNSVTTGRDLAEPDVSLSGLHEVHMAVIDEIPDQQVGTPNTRSHTVQYNEKASPSFSLPFIAGFRRTRE